jgi:signal transduction histidine kinase/PAS domain-containing protein
MPVKAGSGRADNGRDQEYAPGGSLNRLQLRLIRRRRVALQARLAHELAPVLGTGRAHGEAADFLVQLESALRDGRPRAIRSTVSDAFRRWLELGADPLSVTRTLFALVLEKPLFERVRDALDPWVSTGAFASSLLDAIPQPMLVLDTEGRVRHANSAFTALAGFDPARARLTPFANLLTERTRSWAASPMASSTALPGRHYGRVRLASVPDLELIASARAFAVGGARLGWFVMLLREPDLMAAAPDVADMLERETRQKEKFAALLAVSHTVVTTLELDTIIPTIAKQVRRVIQTDECTVFLLDDRENLLRPVVCDVENYEEEMLAVRLRPGEGISGHVALSGRGEIVNHAEDDPRAMQVPGTPTEVSSLLCVPLFERERVVGVITLVRVGENHTLFVDEDLELATLFAGQCSAALANARLFEGMKGAFEELRATQHQLVQSAKLNALGEMAGGVAHDFNNILAAILGRTQLLLQNVQDPEVRRQLSVVEQAALDGAQTVRRVQEFTRVRHDERFETLDVNTVLSGVIELTRPAWEAGAKRRGVSVEIRRELAAARAIAGDASELREVFTNLILNAVDALPDGGRIVVATADEGDDVVVRIADDGIGMDEDTRSRVFDPFFTTKSVKGTGLGLSVAYGIVTRHRGEIEVNSTPGHGTEFVLRFPFGEIERPEPDAGGLGPVPALRCLCVDDEEPVLAVLADLLRAMGQEVHTALGGPAGLAALERQRYDVVFSDLGMPDVNGWELALAVKARQPSCAVVLATGWGHQVEGGTAQAHGVDLVMPKPFSFEDVERVLRRLPELAGGGREAA